MSDYNYHDPDAIARSAEPYFEHASQINAARLRMTELLSGVHGATAGDYESQEFVSAYLDIGGEMHDGLLTWSDAVRSTGDNIKVTAHIYSAAEDNAVDSSKALDRSMSNFVATPPDGSSAVVEPTERMGRPLGEWAGGVEPAGGEGRSFLVGAGGVEPTEREGRPLGEWTAGVEPTGGDVRSADRGGSTPPASGDASGAGRS
jgi:hypothetical protein